MVPAECNTTELCFIAFHCVSFTADASAQVVEFQQNLLSATERAGTADETPASIEQEAMETHDIFDPVPKRLRVRVGLGTLGALFGGGSGMARNLKALGLWRTALVASVRQDGPDLSARQMAIMLQIYLTDPPHTVRGLAAMLNISKPAVTRALDRLSLLGFTKRKRDTEDKRNVLVQRTVKGSVFLSDFAELVIQAGAVAPEDMATVKAEEELAAAAKARLEAELRKAEIPSYA